MTTPAALAQRFSDRLVQLLDQHGYPKDPVSRSRSVAKILGGADASFGARFLSGKEPPGWVQLGLLCEFFDVEPGFFLDSTINNKVPLDTEAVRGLTGGDTIAWKAPSGSDPDAGGRKLGWLSGKRVANSFDRTDLVIVNQVAELSFKSEAETLCIAESDEGRFFAVKMHARQSHRATLEYLETPPTGATVQGLIALTSTRSICPEAMRQSGLVSINPVVGSMRVANNMRF